MALKIRLARGGSKKHPFYRIVVAEASSPRDGRFVERLGSYDPMVAKDHQNRVTLNNERITYWMSKGAKPTLRVHKILAEPQHQKFRDCKYCSRPRVLWPGKNRAFNIL